jgi:hypothetical protein
MEYQYNIKIIGTGTRDEIVDALKVIINAIDDANIGVLDGAEWEDATLMTTINAV